MPRMGVSTESLKGLPPLPVGIYHFRLDGFKPQLSKAKTSTNFNPVLKVINHPTLNDRIIFCSLNSGAGFIQLALVHALGLQMEVEGDTAFMPGKFIEDQGDPENVEKWRYEGPMLSRTGRLEIYETSYQGKPKTTIKQFFCAHQGCTEKHPTELG
jgi:hypothetical protein